MFDNHKVFFSVFGRCVRVAKAVIHGTDHAGKNDENQRASFYKEKKALEPTDNGRFTWRMAVLCGITLMEEIDYKKT